jgi:hydrogenase large subunit
MAVAHYLEALDFQKDIVKIQTIFGGKNPHPNWMVGGMPCSINLNETGAVGTVNKERLNQVAQIVDRTIEFIDQVYIPDLLAVASFYKTWTYGGGISSQNLLSYGDFPEIANDYTAKSLAFSRGAILGGDLSTVHEVDLDDKEQIQEFVDHSWYTYDADGKGLHPYDGVTNPKFVLGPNTKGEKTKIEAVDEKAKYSWVKAPRYKGQPMEVGPLARYVIGYAQGKPEFKEPVDKVLTDLGLPLTAIFSTLGRTAARGLEASWAAHKMKHYLGELMTTLKSGDTACAFVDKWEPATWAKKAQGHGFVEAPRGALGHWIVIENERIANYQCIVPTTWNASPRGQGGEIGAYEAALMNTPMEVADQPVEILRTIHSFDPCLACATHVVSPDGRELTTVKVR